MPGASLMTHSQFRRLAWLLLIALLVNSIPGVAAAPAPVAAGRLSAPATAVAHDPAPPTSTSQVVQPVADPHLPSLSLHLAVAPDPLAVGETAVVTLTVINDAPDPARALVVTLPTPDGALALPGPNTLGPTQGWQWSVGQLVGHSRTT